MAEPSLQDTVAELNRKPWREHFGVHPAAELFPPLSPAELEALAADIKERGMLVPIIVGHHAPGEKFDIVDGRSRLDAAALAGLPLFVIKDGKIVRTFRDAMLRPFDDPYAIVIAANAKRRHLTAAMRREAIGKYLKARQDQSDRQIGVMFGVDHKTIGAVRREGEATGEISPVDRTIGADGKSRPVKRKARKTAAAASAPATPPPRTAPAATTQRAAALDQTAETRRGAVETVGDAPPVAVHEIFDAMRDDPTGMASLVVERLRWTAAVRFTAALQTFLDKYRQVSAVIDRENARRAAAGEPVRPREADGPPVQDADEDADLTPEGVDATAQKLVENHGAATAADLACALVWALPLKWVREIDDTCIRTLEPQDDEGNDLEPEEPPRTGSRKRKAAKQAEATSETAEPRPRRRKTAPKPKAGPTAMREAITHHFRIARQQGVPEHLAVKLAHDKFADLTDEQIREVRITLDAE